MIVRKSQGHHRTNAGTAIHCNNSIGDGSDGKDCGLRLDDNCGERVYSKHTKIADGESAACDIGWTQLAAARALRKIATRFGNLGELGFVRILNYGSYYAILHRHRQPDVYVRIRMSSFAVPTCIQSRVLLEHTSNYFHKQIAVGDFDSV